MNTRENSEIRELTAGETGAVAGGETCTIINDYVNMCWGTDGGRSWFQINDYQNGNSITMGGGGIGVTVEPV